MDGYVGVITTFTCNYAPEYWMPCNGQLLQVKSYQALFSLLGNTYGGDGENTFALPDLRGRAPIHQGEGAGLQPYALAQGGGVEQVTLTAENLPYHMHDGEAQVFMPVGDTNDTDTPGPGTFLGPIPSGYATALPEVPGLMKAPAISDVQIQPMGAGAPVPVTSPYLALNFIICVQGYYPNKS